MRSRINARMCAAFNRAHFTTMICLVLFDMDIGPLVSCAVVCL
jgi:hypothetical protein